MSLINGHSKFIPETGCRRPKFWIELPGNPILGDGKLDNQNHTIIFYHGEYLQLIDVNQDNYLEECLEIRNVLAEFEEYSVSEQSPTLVHASISSQRTLEFWVIWRLRRNRHPVHSGHGLWPRLEGLR